MDRRAEYYRRVDDRPFGGGPGMVMMAEPLEKCLLAIRQDRAAQNPNAAKVPVVLFSPIGQTLTHAGVESWSQSDGAILICGRYEGLDQRFIDAHVDVQISLGDFVLSGGNALPTFNDFFWGTEDFLFSEKSVLSDKDRGLIEQARDLIMKYTDELYQSSPVHIIHADFHGWNLMWHEGQLSIFDFDDCGFGVEAQDLAVALYYLDTPEQDAALLNGYKSVRPLPTYSELAMKALLLQRRLLLLNYLFETKNQEHKEMLPAYLEKSLERVSTFLTDVRG